MPDWLIALTLAAAAWRVFHLLAYDDILDRPRNWLVGVQGADDFRRPRLAEFLECPYCLGAWVSLAWAGAFVLWQDTVWVAAPFALNTAVIVGHRVLSDG